MSAHTQSAKATKTGHASKAPAKFVKIPVITAVMKGAVVAYGYLHKPDTEGQYADDKYKAQFVFAGDTDTTDLDAKIAEAAVANGWKPAGVKPCYSIIDSDDEDKAEEFRGKLIIKAKSKFQPDLRDANRNPLPAGVDVRSGDLVNIIIQMVPNTAGGQKQVSPRLLAVQLIEKRTGRTNAGDGFGEEEGYVATAADSSGSDGGNDDEF